MSRALSCVTCFSRYTATVHFRLNLFQHEHLQLVESGIKIMKFHHSQKYCDLTGLSESPGSNRPCGNRPRAAYYFIALFLNIRFRVHEISGMLSQRFNLTDQ